MLQKHLTSESAVRLHEERRGRKPNTDMQLSSLAYSSRYATQDVPKYEIPKSSVEPQVAYQLIHDELELDGRPAMNCASFVHTWMEPEADKLIMENIAKNLSDQDEYPSTMRVQERCISIIGNLWHAQEAIGTATVGSSEAIMLGGLALKKAWQNKRKAEGKDASKPNIIFGNNAQVALEKFARYFDVEERLIPVSAESHHVLDVEKAVEACDENTIGIFVILGSTYTGHFEDVKRLSELLDEHEKKTGHSINIHVDAASGGFIAPFAFPGLEWDFRLPRVVSINSSGHKFGLSYAGIGWVLWRSTEYLPKELVFELHYLGGTQYSFNLNFSRPACFMISQYYNLIRLGAEGFTRIVENDLSNARLLSEALEETNIFDLVSDMHRAEGVFGWQQKLSTKDKAKEKGKKSGLTNYNPSLPVVSFKLTDEYKEKHKHVKQSAISTLLRTNGWIVPNYALPPNEDKIEILRVVVRESLSRDMVHRLVDDILQAVDLLTRVDAEMQTSEYAPLEYISEVNKRPRADNDHAQHKEVKKPRTYARTC